MAFRNLTKFVNRLVTARIDKYIEARWNEAESRLEIILASGHPEEAEPAYISAYAAPVTPQMLFVSSGRLQNAGGGGSGMDAILVLTSEKQTAPVQKSRAELYADSIDIHGSVSGVQIGDGSGERIKAGFNFNLTSANVDGSSRYTHPHTLNRAPSAILVCNAQANGRTISQVGRTAGDFTVEARDPAGGLLAAGVGIQFAWLAIA